MDDDLSSPIDGSDWPLFGWSSDIRGALKRALEAGRPAVLATLFRRDGSAPRDAGAQMLFDGTSASGYFSGDCIEADVARHAAGVLADGQPRVLVYGAGSPWIDIRLRCGGTLHILVERIAADCAAAGHLLQKERERRPCLWSSDGRSQSVSEANGEPLVAHDGDPLRIARRFDPPRRMVISGGDPVALALARLAADAQFETVLVRPDGPEGEAPLPGVRYLRGDPVAVMRELGIDRWTGYIGATHEDRHDLAACAHALHHGAGYVGMIGAQSRAPARLAAMAALGASEAELAQLNLPAGLAGFGKAPWEVAVSVLAEAMQAMTPSGTDA